MSIRRWVGEAHVHDRLYCGTEIVANGVFDERVEGPAKPGLTNKLKRRTAHPIEHVDLALAILHAHSDGILEPASDVIEDGDHVPHVCNREDGVEHPALFAVAFTDGCEQTIAEHQVALAKSTHRKTGIPTRCSVCSLQDDRRLLVDILILHNNARQCQGIIDVETPGL